MSFCIRADFTWIINEVQETDGNTRHERWKRGEEFSPPRSDSAAVGKQ